MLLERDIKNFVSRLGGTILSIHVGKHYKVVSLFNGKIVKFVHPKSPSDSRGLKNLESHIRKQIKE
ncbi:hypothetical protein EBR37_03770 [bacterium]|nr:hypothetical protein [bacterium]